MVRLLVPGGKGQIGSHVARQAVESGFDVAAPGSDQLDISDKISVSGYVDQYKPDIVINCAAFTAVDEAESEPEKARATNVGGPKWLAEICEDRIPILHISTDYVFSGNATTPYMEDGPTNPINEYGRGKLAGEQALLDGHPQSLIIRTAWVYSASHENFLKTMLRLAEQRDEISVVEDQTGCPTHATDIADTLLRMAEQIQPGEFQSDWHGIYHYCSSSPTSWYGFAKVVLNEFTRHTGKQVNLKPITSKDYPTPARRPRSSVLDCSKIGDAFGIVPQAWEKQARQTVRDVLKYGKT